MTMDFLERVQKSKRKRKLAQPAEQLPEQVPAKTTEDNTLDKHFDSVSEDLLARYETPLVSVDMVVLTIQKSALMVLLKQRRRDPYEHMWGIPGGFIHMAETLEEAATRRLQEQTTIKNIYLEQLATFGQPQRDPRGRVITVAYSALVRAETLTVEAQIDNQGANVEKIGWFNVNELPPLAFDHALIVEQALNHLKSRIESSSVAFRLLPNKFTLTELQRVYELILNKTLDKRNFRKKILASGLLVDTAETKMDGYHRPAQLYAFKSVTE